MSDQKSYYGKYRGKVLDNVDPLMLGRVLPMVPGLSGMPLNWALPCMPYAGSDVGFYAIPPIGASIWVEFEGGNPNYPIWVGCFWQEGEMPASQEPIDPACKWIKTESNTLVLSDIPAAGGVQLTTSTPAVETECVFEMSSSGVHVLVAETEIVLQPDNLTLSCVASGITLTENALKLANDATSVSIEPTQINLDGPVAISRSLEVQTGVAIYGEATFTGGISAQGNVEIAGNVGILGSVSIGGEVSIQGRLGVSQPAYFTEIHADAFPSR